MTSIYVYWISTGLLSLLYLTSATMYIFKAEFVQTALADVQFPASFLRNWLIAAKLLGVAAILSRISVPLSDLAYAGMLFHLMLAGMAHLGVRKPMEALPAAIGLVLLVASFTTQNAAREVHSAYAPTITVESTAN